MKPRAEQMRRRIGLIVERCEQDKINNQQNQQFCRCKERKIARNPWPKHGSMLTRSIRPGLDIDQTPQLNFFQFCNLGLF
jgi:hypothetical protein